MNRLLTEADSVAVDAESDSDLNPTLAFLQRLLEILQAERPKMHNGEVGIGPFEQLQTQFSPAANNLYFFKQLVSGAFHQQLATDPSGPYADSRFSHFWHALAAAPIEEGTSGSQAQALRNRVDALVNSLLKLHESHAAARGLQAVSPEASAPKTDANLAAIGPTEHLLFDKMTRAAASTEGHASDMSKLSNRAQDGQLFAGLPKDLDSEAAVEHRMRQATENSHAAKTQVTLKAAEQVVNPNLAAASIAGKPSEAAMSIKNAGLPNNMLPADQAGSKVIQIDGEAKGSGFLTQQEHLSEHLTKSEHAPRASEAAQRSLASQTMNQIVQKAVLLQNNGQHTVQIDLKPDFLGQIRMQIVTESQQVAVRIVAELPFVKDMLESNLNQLKAELQAQGLQVDELEVSVAHDSRADDDQYQQAAQARRARNMKNSSISDDAAAEEQSGRLLGRDDEMADTVIDYFA